MPDVSKEKYVILAQSGNHFVYFQSKTESQKLVILFNQTSEPFTTKYKRKTDVSASYLTWW